MEIYIPDGFKENRNCIRYPYSNMPAVILTNTDKRIDITFNKLSKTLTKEQTKAAILAVLRLLEKRSDITKTSTRHYFKGGNVNGYWLYYVNKGINEAFINFLSVFPIGNRFTMVTLSTAYDNRKEGRKIFLDMLTSVRDKTLP